MSGKIKIGLIFACLGLFLFFVFLRFPFKNIRGYVFQEIYKETRIFIVAEDLSPSFFGWPGIAIHKADVTIPLGTTTTTLSSDKMIFRVGLGQLFPPVPSVSLSLKKLKKGGDLFLKLTQGKTFVNAKWDADEVRLENLTSEAGASQLTGYINSYGKVQYQMVDVAKSSGSAEIEIQKLKTPAEFINMAENYGFLIPAMQIGTVRAKLEIKNGVVQITNFTIGDTSADLRGSVTGELRLGSTIEQSMLNITLKLQISDKILKNSQAQAFVSFLSGYQGTSPGEYAMRWNTALVDFMPGSLSINILPKKVN